MRHVALSVSMVMVVAGAMAASAAADWYPNDTANPTNHKMHYPQMPMVDGGWDVDFTCPNRLADDWLCTGTGPVSDVHFWISTPGDFTTQPDDPLPIIIQNVSVSIHDNIADIDPGDPQTFSMPGQERWGRDFAAADIVVQHWAAGVQGWYDPVEPYFLPSSPPDHINVYQVNITGIPDAFVQQEGTVYWLNLSVQATDATTGQLAKVGWKTTLDPFMDNAVYFTPIAPSGVLPLLDPETGDALNLAFVITPEPATVALMGLGLLGAVATRRRRT